MGSIPKFLQRKADDINQTAKSRGYKSFISSLDVHNLFIKQNGKCAICKKVELAKGNIVADHIKAIGCGGHVSDINNIQLLCPACNKTKTYSENPRDGRKAMHRVTIVLRIFDGCIEARGGGYFTKGFSITSVLMQLSSLMSANIDLPWTDD